MTEDITKRTIEAHRGDGEKASPNPELVSLAERVGALDAVSAT